MPYVKFLAVVLLAGCLGGVLGSFMSQGQYGVADSDTLQGLGRGPQDLAVIIAAPRDPAVLAEQVAALKEQGRARKREDNQESVSPLKNKRNSEYLTARIARDKPERLQEMKIGKASRVRPTARS